MGVKQRPTYCPPRPHYPPSPKCLFLYVKLAMGIFWTWKSGLLGHENKRLKVNKSFVCFRCLIDRRLAATERSDTLAIYRSRRGRGDNWSGLQQCTLIIACMKVWKSFPTIPIHDIMLCERTHIKELRYSSDQSNPTAKNRDKWLGGQLLIGIAWTTFHSCWRRATGSLVVTTSGADSLITSVKKKEYLT